jgi:hypothetical protein
VCAFAFFARVFTASLLLFKMAAVESQHSMLDSLYLRELLSDRQHAYVFVSASVLLLFVGAVFASRFFEVKSGNGQRSLFSSYMRFAYVNFFKPHTGDHERNQQGALESFYNAQVGRQSCLEIQ